MNIYELYGRQAEQLTQLGDYFRITQKLLNDLMSGSVLPSQLVITQSGWQLGDAYNHNQPGRHVGDSPESMGGISGEDSGGGREASESATD